jgi:hypothetical protein
MKIPAINQRDFNRRALQLLCGSQSAESAAENDDSMFFPHSFSPKRNLIKPSIISPTMILSRLMNRIRGRIAALFAPVVALTAVQKEALIRQQIVANPK